MMDNLHLNILTMELPWNYRNMKVIITESVWLVQIKINTMFIDMSAPSLLITTHGQILRKTIRVNKS